MYECCGSDMMVGYSVRSLSIDHDIHMSCWASCVKRCIYSHMFQVNLQN